MPPRYRMALAREQKLSTPQGEGTNGGQCGPSAIA